MGARYIGDSIQAQKRIVHFLDSIKESAKCIYLVGDILDYWYEYRYVVPRGFTRFLGKLAELADDGIEITWIIGNHDIWIFDYIPQELGVKVIDGDVVANIDGTKFYISHGDAIDDESRSFKILRKIFRNRFCQRLFAAIHPRWTIPFALNWSKQSRTNSEYTPTPSSDKFVKFANNYLDKSPDTKFFIFGHLHIVEQRNLNYDAKLIVLGDWISNFSYACFDGETLTIHKYTE